MPFVVLAKSRPAGWLFPGRKTGSHITSQALYDRVKLIAKKVGLPDVSPHWFRHAFATHSIQKGCDVVTVSKQLGHASLATTTKYTHAKKGAGASNFLNFGSNVTTNVSNVGSNVSTNVSNGDSRGSDGSSCSSSGSDNQFKMQLLQMYKNGDISLDEFKEMLK